MRDTTQRLRGILEIVDVPENIIRELEAKPPDYQAAFLDAIETIIVNECINLFAFMEIRKSIKEKARLQIC